MASIGKQCKTARYQPTSDLSNEHRGRQDHCNFQWLYICMLMDVAMSMMVMIMTMIV
jgi:hypothetical protein